LAQLAIVFHDAMKIASLFALFSLTAGSLTAEITHFTDFAAAQALAKKENKDLLLEFTGLDWCDGCKGLRARVFGYEEFQEWMVEEYVWVALDFPVNKSVLAMIPEDLKKQNEALRERYPVRGYPTVYLCDSGGRPYARRAGFDAMGTPDEYLLELGNLSKVKKTRDAAFQKARGLKGAERNAALAEALSVVPLNCLREFYPRHLATLEKELPEAEVVKDFHAFMIKRDLLAELGKMQRQGAHDAIIARVSELVAPGTLQGEDLQEMLIFKARAEFAKDDREAAIQTVTEVTAINLRNIYGVQANQLSRKMGARNYQERMGGNKQTGRPPQPGFKLLPRGKIKKYLPGESPALEKKDLSTLSLVALKSSLGLTREEITRVTKVVAKEHGRWEVLDAEYRKAKNDPEIAKSYRAAIARFKVRHDKNHATLETLKGLVIKHQEAIMRQGKIHQAEGEAEDLLKSAEELRKKAEEVERAGS
jgi:thioredoxin-related protein